VYLKYLLYSKSLPLLNFIPATCAKEKDERCTDKKENKVFLIYKEIQMGSGAKSYMR
jgi:hypothetical protein